MWYWVKSTAGAESDYNLTELKSALRDGKVRLEWTARRHDEKRWMTISELLTIERDDSEADPGGAAMPEQEREQKRQPEPDRHDEAPTASFTCFQCGGSLRIHLSRLEAAYRCPKCRAEFRVTKAGDSPLVFVVVPNMSQFTSTASDTSARRKREIPREVLAALSALGLEETASFEQVRSAYRELVKGYHPDKVAHLGPDLRRVAEAKTKEINSAYSVLETFYAA